MSTKLRRPVLYEQEMKLMVCPHMSRAVGCDHAPEDPGDIIVSELTAMRHVRRPGKKRCIGRECVCYKAYEVPQGWMENKDLGSCLLWPVTEEVYG